MSYWAWEFVCLLAYACLFSRWWFQLWSSRKAGASVNPLRFWVLTFIGATLLTLYGANLGSVMMVVAYPFSVFVIYYNVILELKK